MALLASDRANKTLQFWNAAKFYRRAPNRDQKNAIKVLTHIAASHHEPLRRRAIDILKGIANEHARKD